MIANDENQKKRNFQYKRLVGSNFRVKKNCSCFTLNNDSTILFVGQDSGIVKLVMLYNHQKLIQQLHNHNKSVICLLWMKKAKTLISGSNDRSIFFWNQTYNTLQRLDQTKKGHQGFINCLKMHQDENLLISGGDDETIKFWKRENENFNCQQTINTKFRVYSLSLNNSSKFLISSGNNDEIKVYECQTDEKWIIIQTIINYIYGVQLCFILDNSFVVQQQGYLEIYNYIQELNQFIIAKQVQITNDQSNNAPQFTIQFIKMNNILIMENNNHIYIVYRETNVKYNLKQQIEFQSPRIIGTLSDSGQLLVTWDGDWFDSKGSNQIKLMRLFYLD